MNWMVRNALKFGYSLWELALSVAGGFMFVRGSRYVERAGELPSPSSSMRFAEPRLQPFAGIGIALFLLAFIGGEAVMTVRAFRRESSVTTLPANPPAATTGQDAQPVSAPAKEAGNLLPGDSGQAAAPVTRRWPAARASHKLQAVVHSASPSH